jgi:NlpC/P60 family
MDCSGTVYRVLRDAGVSDVPRSSHEQYRWVWESGRFRAVNGRSFDSFEFDALKPGDLLFWTGTYEPREKRDPPVSHVMIYLGRAKDDGRHVMFGSSDGRPFRGLPQRGVSVFDFRLPAENSTVRFIGYGPIPGLPPVTAVANAARSGAEANMPSVGPPAPPDTTASGSKKRVATKSSSSVPVSKPAKKKSSPPSTRTSAKPARQNR